MRACSPAVFLAVLVLAGCGDNRPEADPFGNPASTGDTTRASITDIQKDRAAIEADLARLAEGENTDSADAIAVYDKARSELERRGPLVETMVIDALRTSPRWGVRLGCVEVLQSIGTKASIEHLIAVTDDVMPLVARRANTGLETMTDIRMVVMQGESATSSASLPRLPPPAETDIAIDRHERTWATWHARHGKELRAAWTDWWKANKATAKIR